MSIFSLQNVKSVVVPNTNFLKGIGAAAAVDAEILGYYMYKSGQEFKGRDGIVTNGVEATITNIGQLANEGINGYINSEIMITARWGGF